MLEAVMSAEESWRPEIVPGAQVFLSHVRQSDVPLFARWFADLELTAYIGLLGVAFTPAQEQQWYDGLADSKEKIFAIIVREGQHLIGSITLHNIDQHHGIAELGIAIGDKTAWGQGFGSQATRLMADYGLTFLGLHTIYLWHAAYNSRGHRAYLKAGFRESGRIHGGVLLDGQRYDRVLMEATRESLGPSQTLKLVRQIEP
jgi:RimJ/RimL family protein N-acetyltransferase